MIKKLFLCAFVMMSISIAAQSTNTITIDWSFNSTPTASGNANSSRTIEVGDTVTWNWYANGNHNVKSSGSSNEIFESAFFNNGGTFSYTFTSVGTNDYTCTNHPGSMFGIITVVAEGTLSLDSFEKLGTIDMYPNPSNSKVTFDFQIQKTEKLNIKVYNLLGKEVLAKQISKNNPALIIAGLNNGIYMVRITTINGKNSTTKRLVKN